jgi:Rrf2 family nitric oxide-sensitive transcriptional repressor
MEKEGWTTQLNVTTDYSIRIILCLASKDGIVSSREISEKMAIPQKYVLKIMRTFTKAGIVKRYSGAYGGFELIKRKGLTLYDIMLLVEPTMRINRCMEDDCYCSRNAVPFCPVRKVYTALQAQIDAALSAVTIEDLVRPDGPDMVSGKICKEENSK